jgi:hypothetical protein
MSDRPELARVEHLGRKKALTFRPTELARADIDFWGRQN